MTTEQRTIRSIRWNGKIVSFRKMPDGKRFIRVRRRIKEHDVCPLCKAAFVDENTTSVVLIISNQAGVPNRFVHSECLADKTDEYVFRLIAEDYKDALEFAHWF